MKKSIIALMGLFTLIACSEDSYQAADNMNESGTVENGSGGMQTNSIDPAIPYESPFDFTGSGCCSVVRYLLINNTDLELKVSPFAGLARFDGVQDDYHMGWGNQLIFGTYPNLLYANFYEYINFVKCKEITVLPFTTLDSGPGGQLPIYGTGGFFEIANTTTHHEMAILYEYGKLYSFDFEVNDTAFTLDSGSLRFPFLPAAISDPRTVSDQWQPMGITTGLECYDLWYNVHTLEINIGNSGGYCPIDPQIHKMASEKIIIHPDTGKRYVLQAYTTPTDVVISFDNL